MKIIVIGSVEMQREFEYKGVPQGVEVHFETSPANVTLAADAYFFLMDEDEIAVKKKWISDIGNIVFVNAVSKTLTDLPGNAIRINAWPGFLQRSMVEVSASQQNAEGAVKILHTLNWQYQLVPDVEGFISARIISMIINEAYFALGDKVSSKEDIDTAMKLGTNYPYGPFEWSKLIGLKNIHLLLTTLSKSDERYTPAPSLLKDI